MNKKIEFSYSDYLTSRLSAYAALASALCLFHNEAKAKIVCTDLNPDFHVIPTSYGHEYDLDLNNDGIVDFEIQSWESLSYPGYQSEGATWVSWLDIFGLNSTGYNNYVLANGYALPLDFQQPINSNSQWELGGQLASNRGTNPNNWYGLHSKYAGLRIKVNGDYHYGWVRLTVDGYNKCFVEEYAYETTPDKALYAGEGGNNNPLDVTESAYGNVLQLKFESKGKQNIDIELIDVSGKVFYSRSDYALDGYNEYTLDMNELPVAFIVSIRGRNSRDSQLIVRRN